MCLSYFFVMPLAFTYLIFYSAYTAPHWVTTIASNNDISYGLYLYGGPLQQLYYAYAVDHVLLFMNNFFTVYPMCIIFWKDNFAACREEGQTIVWLF